MWLAATLAALALAARPASAQRAASVNCGASRRDLAEREVCASPDLTRLAGAIDSATRALRTHLTGADRDALLDTEHPFVVTRNDCQNAAGQVHACVQRIMSARFDALTLAASAPSSIQSEVARYPFVDVPYVSRWGNRLVTERLDVWGCLRELAATRHGDGQRLTVTSTCSTGEARALSVRPATLSPADSVFLRSGPRMGYWRGTLARAGNGYALVGWRPGP